MESNPTRIDGIPLTRHWLIPKGKQPKVYVPHPVMSADDIRARTQGVWDRFYSWRNIWARSVLRQIAEVAARLRHDLEALSPDVRQHRHRHRQRAHQPIGHVGATDRETVSEALRGAADAGPEGAAGVGAPRGVVRAIGFGSCRPPARSAVSRPDARTAKLPGAGRRLPRVLRPRRGARSSSSAPRRGRSRRPAGWPTCSARCRRRWRVSAGTPRSRCRDTAASSAGTRVETFPVTVGGFSRDVGFFEAPLADGARALLVDCPDLFDREALYGVDNADYPDNPRRFALLVRAALEFAARRGAPPSIVHAHDWQAGLAPVYLQHAVRRASDARRHAERLHDSQPRVSGRVRRRLAAASRSGVGAVHASDRLEFWGHISFLKGGINDADLITTVSPRYAEEIQTPEFGLRLRRHPARAPGAIWSAS